MNSNFKVPSKLCYAEIKEDGNIGEMKELGSLKDIKEVSCENQEQEKPSLSEAIFKLSIATRKATHLFKRLAKALKNAHKQRIFWYKNTGYLVDPRKYKRLMKRKSRGLEPFKRSNQ